VKVLLVGPDPEQAGLRCPGVEVFERDAVKVPDPVDALSRLITIDPTIIFLSPALQVRDAVAFARTVRARPEGDRVALAAWARRSAHPALYDAGVDACLAVEDAEEEVRRQITQLVRVAERADRARQRIVDLLDRVEDIVYAHDAEGRYTFVNAAVERLTGWKREEVIGRRFQELLTPEAIPISQEMMGRKLRG
jgi:PAS domain-containing protein